MYVTNRRLNRHVPEVISKFICHNWRRSDGAWSIANRCRPVSYFRIRVRGPNGANDEFIEIANNSGADHTVTGGGTGYAVAASNGVTRCVIPNGTVIPNRGHYLCVNSVGFSLASYPPGNGTTATGDATYTTDIPDNAGIAIFNTSVGANSSLQTEWTPWDRRHRKRIRSTRRARDIRANSFLDRLLFLQRQLR